MNSYRHWRYSGRTFESYRVHQIINKFNELLVLKHNWGKFPLTVKFSIFGLLCLPVSLIWIKLTYQSQGYFAPANWRSNAEINFLSILLLIVSSLISLASIKYLLSNISTKSLLKLIITIAVLSGIISLTILPTQSQDFYHDYFIFKSMRDFGQNPFTTDLNNAAYPAIDLVKDWRDYSFIYGPLMGWIIWFIVVVGRSLTGSIILIKLIYIWIIWVVGKQIFNSVKDSKSKLFGISIWLFNPLIWQYSLIDLHNDVLIGFGIYWASNLLSKYNPKSLISIFSVIGLKYIGLILLPITYMSLLMKFGIKRFKLLTEQSLLIIIFAVIVMLPFGFSEVYDSFRSISGQADLIQLPLGAKILFQFGFSVTMLKIIGSLMAIITSIVLFRARIMSNLYLFPIIVFMVFGLGSFHPWYLLWILPLAILRFSFIWLTLIWSWFMLFNPALSSVPVDRSMLCLIILMITINLIARFWEGQQIGKPRLTG